MNILQCVIVTFTLSFLLSACQPPEPATQQQHFVCKTLIEGFLKTQNLRQYQLNNTQPPLSQSTQQRIYHYQASSDNQIQLNMPHQQNLNFRCDQTSAYRFELNLLDQHNIPLQHLLGLNLPTQNTIKNLTTFVLKTQ